MSNLFLLPQISQKWKLFYFLMLKKKIWASFQRILELFLPKNLSLSSKKYGVGIRDLGSGKNLFRTGLEKTRVFFKKPSPVGFLFFFGFFRVFWGFLGFFGFFWVFLPRREGFRVFFSFKNTFRCIQTLNYNHSY